MSLSKITPLELREKAAKVLPATRSHKAIAGAKLEILAIYGQLINRRIDLLLNNSLHSVFLIGDK